MAHHIVIAWRYVAKLNCHGAAVRDIDLNAFTERLNSESDRACAVLGAALLDAKLEELLRRQLRCFQNELLKGMGPLGTFSARIRVARAMDWINEDARCDLDTVRKIRNDFAHSFDHNLAFGDQSIADRCCNLRTAQAHLEGFDLAADRPNRNVGAVVFRAMQAVFKPPRWRFQLTVEFLAQYLDEIGSNLQPYSGPDLLEEVRDLSANTTLQISFTANDGSPPATSI